MNTKLRRFSNLHWSTFKMLFHFSLFSGQIVITVSFFDSGVKTILCVRNLTRDRKLQDENKLFWFCMETEWN